MNEGGMDDNLQLGSAQGDNDDDKQQTRTAISEEEANASQQGGGRPSLPTVHSGKSLEKEEDLMGAIYGSSPLHDDSPSTSQVDPLSLLPPPITPTAQRGRVSSAQQQKQLAQPARQPSTNTTTPASPRLALFASKLARRSSGSGGGGGGELTSTSSNNGTAAAAAGASAAPRSPMPSASADDAYDAAAGGQKNSKSPLRSTLLAAAYPMGLLLSPQTSSKSNDGSSSRGPNLRRMRRNQDALARSAPSSGSVAVVDENELLTADRNYRRVIRRFREGDHVLVSCHNYPSSLSGAARFGFASSLVNQHGYPPNQGETPAERSGPYKYVLAQVKVLHFEEIVTYYTVTRCDTHQDQRADAEFMEPIRTPEGLQAAMVAAAASSTSSSALSSNAMVGGGRRSSGLAARTLDAPHPSRSMSGGLGRGASLTFRAGGSGRGGQDGNGFSQAESFNTKQARAQAVPSFRERCWEALCCGCCRPFCRSDTCRNACSFVFRAACWLPTTAYELVVTKCFDKCLHPVINRLLGATRKQASLVLNGIDPYRCRIRFTAVNFIVLCSIWYMFVDMARLAFFPPTTDTAIAIVNLTVWAILLLELLLEVFIRPDGYSLLIVSEKAFAPTTERYISAFHLAVEFLSLLVFIPEFYCIFSRAVTCGERLPFSYINSALLGVIGPTRADVFYGQAYAALIRLRIFGLVRHWKNMWVANTFINQKWKGKDPGLLSSIVPYSKLSRSVSHRHKKRHQLLSGEQPDDHRKESGTALSETVKAPVDPEVVEQRKRENALTNASTIGTALMVTNSYRALAILWIIVGIFPIVTTFLDQYMNPIAYELTRQMQATNLVASDNNLSTCEYLRDSMWAWLTAIQLPGSGDSDAPYLLTLDILPTRCPFQMFENQTAGVYCPNYMETSTSSPQVGRAEASNVSDEVIVSMCQLWELTAAAQSTQGIADALGIRVGAILFYNESDVWNLTNVVSGDTALTTFSIAANFDATVIVSSVAFSCFILQLCFLVMVLGGLTVLRRDAEVLVLGPLRRMLKRVARYARNPLMPPKIKSSSRGYGNGNQKRAASTGSNADDDDPNDEWNNSDSSDDEGQEAAADGAEEDMLGSYETEQLNSAVNKITDLLRKCWGVAGADIISTNLAARGGALTEMFNPTVPGKSVYALFGFVSINDFDHVLRELQDDVMILINDVAAVLHEEVFRWGFGHSGQCNKNLGSAFLMVFRIGLVKEVMEKLEQATDVVFSTKSSHSHPVRKRLHNRFNSMGSAASVKSSLSGGSNHASPMTSSILARNASGAVNRMGSGFAGGAGGAAAGTVSGAPSTTVGTAGMLTSAGLMAHLRRKEKRPTPVNPMSLSLQSLPGITTFTDRAVIGMLKSFAGIYRDKKILNWNQDFRLGQGVGIFTVSMIFGMDAGWAVEGAVGSEYKIDATYLSPHVNMASRMMGACKQYGVTLMLSQAVQELMSDVARTKLRHLDTITVKGSSIRQRIYTYDARPKGVDFFLFNRTEDQADVDAERYTPQIWNTDQDLRAMRQHVTEDFLSEFERGRKAYLAGDWPVAIRRLERANEIMVETALEEGYMEDEFDALQLRAGEDARAAEEELKMRNGDGPSQLLISFMKQHGGKAPPDWDGWHPLTRK